MTLRRFDWDIAWLHIQRIIDKLSCRVQQFSGSAFSVFFIRNYSLPESIIAS
jgi:hypothetical protein